MMVFYFFQTHCHSKQHIKQYIELLIFDICLSCEKRWCLGEVDLQRVPEWYKVFYCKWHDFFWPFYQWRKKPWDDLGDSENRLRNSENRLRNPKNRLRNSENRLRDSENRLRNPKNCLRLTAKRETGSKAPGCFSINALYSLKVEG